MQSTITTVSFAQLAEELSDVVRVQIPVPVLEQFQNDVGSAERPFIIVPDKFLGYSGFLPEYGGHRATFKLVNKHGKPICSQRSDFEGIMHAPEVVQYALNNLLNLNAKYSRTPRPMNL